MLNRILVPLDGTPTGEAERRFSPAAMTDGYEQVYARLMRGGARSAATLQVPRLSNRPGPLAVRSPQLAPGAAHTAPAGSPVVPPE